MAKRKKVDESAAPTTTEDPASAAGGDATAPDAPAESAPRERKREHHSAPKQLTYEEAMEKRRAGTLHRSVLTDQGWVTP